MIENKGFGEHYDELVSNIPYRQCPFNFLEILHDENHQWNKDNIIERNTRNKIQSDFVYAMRSEYHVSQNTLQTAEMLCDMSDNGTSYKDIEEYIVMLLNYMEEERNTNTIREE